MDTDTGEEVSRTLERQLLLKDRKAEIILSLPFQRIKIPDHQERPVIVSFLIMKPSEYMLDTILRRLNFHSKWCCTAGTLPMK